MATSIIFEGQIEIPLAIRSLADFRRWAQSDEFPEQGRIDYVAGRIEVDMSPEDVFRHGVPKTEIVRMLAEIVKTRNLGYVLTDSTRISSPRSDVSAEPDVVFVSHEAIESGRVRLVPKSGGEEGRYVEVEGAPDVIVEIVSDASVKKDTRRLPEAYFKAAVPEFWLVDARSEPLVFRLHRPGPDAYQPVPVDEEGFQESVVFGTRFRLDGSRSAQGRWRFDLIERPLIS